jgi:hypothetical protein
MVSRAKEGSNRRIHHALHTASRQIIDLLLQEGIGTLIIGKNNGWKNVKMSSGLRSSPGGDCPYKTNKCYLID